MKANGLNSVWLVQPPGKAARTLKTWPLGPWTCIKLLLGIAQPQRQMRGIRWLRRLGVRTPQCYGSWRVRMLGGSPVIQLELQYVPGRSAWEITSGRATNAEWNDRLLLHSAAMVGSIVAKLGCGRLFHRDLKLSNIVIDAANGHSPAVWLIDPVGVRRMRSRLGEIERMLERLAIQPIGLPQPLAGWIRFLVLKRALAPLNRAERRIVLARLRQRAGRSASSRKQLSSRS